jgi:hypothetical protein
MNLQDLYDPESSIMTFEGVQVRGRQAILEKFSVSLFDFTFEVIPYFRLFLSERFSAPSQKSIRSHWPTVPLPFRCSDS